MPRRSSDKCKKKVTGSIEDIDIGVFIVLLLYDLISIPLLFIIALNHLFVREGIFLCNTCCLPS